MPCDYFDSACDSNGVRWILRRVCRLWNHVLEGTPTLWMDLVISPDALRDNVSMTKTLECYLSKSGQHPLWVTIFEPDGKSAFKDSWHAAFWEALCSSMYRWQRLRIRCKFTPVDDVIGHLMPLKLPMLEEVYIETESEDLDPSSPSGRERLWFEDAPQLKRAMVVFILDESYVWYPSTLTHMSADQDNGSVLQHAFSFPNLKELNFDCDSYCEPLPSLTPIFHNALTHLSASGITLRYLILPSLVCLSIEDCSDGYNDHLDISCADSATAFIHRSKCSLTELHLASVCVLREEHLYTELLPLVAPTLVLLGVGVHQHCDAEKVVRSLYPHGGVSWVSPTPHESHDLLTVRRRGKLARRM